MITKSPLSVGAAFSNDTDHDIQLYSDGTPFVPASSISGSFYSKYEYENKKNHFKTNQNSSDLMDESPLFISDGTFINKPLVRERDFNKVAKEEVDEKIKLSKKGNGKFDSLYISEGAKFSFFVIYSTEDESEKEEINSIMLDIALNINMGLFRLGYKQNRGFGKLEVKEVLFKEFNKKNYNEYLNFDGSNFSDFESLDLKTDKEDKLTMSVNAKLVGSIMVKEYRFFEECDQVQMTTKIDGKDVAVIPGTSISGVLQDRVRKIAKELAIKISIDDLIKVIVDEAYIKEGKFIVFSRNCINRFSSNAMKTALYTERPWFTNGKSDCKFKIRFKEKNELLIKLYYLALQDLLMSYAPLGGEVGIGRGMFSGKKEDIIISNDLKGVLECGL